MNNTKFAQLPLVLLVILLVGTLVSGCTLLPNSRDAQRNVGGAADSPTPIPTAIVPNSPTYTVQLGEVVDVMTFSGRVAPVTQEGLYFESSGRVRTVFVQRNEQVKAGTIIAELEIDDLERALTGAQLELERAQTLLNAAERELGYDQRTAEINLEMTQLQLTALQGEEAASTDTTSSTASSTDTVTTTASTDTASTDTASTDTASTDAALQERRVELAQIAVERLDNGVDPLLTNAVSRAELEVQRIEVAIDEARIVAPFNGEMIALTLSPGSAVEAFQPVATLADTTQLEVSADLTSSQMERLEEGMSVEIALNSTPGDTFTGQIRSLPFPYGSGGMADSGGITARVAVMEPTGMDTFVACRHEGEELSAVFRERHDFAPGTTIHLQPDLQRAHLFDAGTGERLVS